LLGRISNLTHFIGSTFTDFWYAAAELTTFTDFGPFFRFLLPVDFPFVQSFINFPLHPRVSRLTVFSFVSGKWNENEEHSLALSITITKIRAVSLPDAVTLGGAYDKGGVSPVVLQGHAVCCSGSGVGYSCCKKRS